MKFIFASLLAKSNDERELRFTEKASSVDWELLVPSLAFIIKLLNIDAFEELKFLANFNVAGYDPLGVPVTLLFVTLRGILTMSYTDSAFRIILGGDLNVCISPKSSKDTMLVKSVKLISLF